MRAPVRSKALNLPDEDNRPIDSLFPGSREDPKLKRTQFVETNAQDNKREK